METKRYFTRLSMESPNEVCNSIETKKKNSFAKSGNYNKTSLLFLTLRFFSFFNKITPNTFSLLLYLT